MRSRSIDLPQFVVNITKAPLLEDPGTRFRYSEATTVLGRIVEVVSKQSFDTFVTTRILQPLGHERHRLLGRMPRRGRG